MRRRRTPRRSRRPLSPAHRGAPVAELSEWLQLMLAEIARKQEELERARLESELRTRERSPDDP